MHPCGRVGGPAGGGRGLRAKGQAHPRPVQLAVQYSITGWPKRRPAEERFVDHRQSSPTDRNCAKSDSSISVTMTKSLRISRRTCSARSCPPPSSCRAPLCRPRRPAGARCPPAIPVANRSSAYRSLLGIIEVHRIHPVACSNMCFSLRRKEPTAIDPRRPAPDAQPGTFRANSAAKPGIRTRPVGWFGQFHLDSPCDRVFYFVFEKFLRLRVIFVPLIPAAGTSLPIPNTNCKFAFERRPPGVSGRLSFNARGSLSGSAVVDPFPPILIEFNPDAIGFQPGQHSEWSKCRPWIEEDVLAVQFHKNDISVQVPRYSSRSSLKKWSFRPDTSHG